jgi:hypothetical protein
MLEVVTTMDSAGRPAETFNVIDGQQRLRTMFEYIDGTEPWTNASNNRSSYEYVPYSELDDEKQSDIADYQLPVAYLRNYSSDDVEDLFQRVQFGMALKPGEKLKSLRSQLRETYVAISGDSTFATDWGKRWANRDYQVMVSAGLLETALKGNPFQRFEFPSIQKFCTSSQYSDSQIQNASTLVTSTLRLCREIVHEQYTPGSVTYRKVRQGPRCLKFLFASLYLLRQNFSLTGLQPALARGFARYLFEADGEGESGRDAPEYQAWRETLRNGRMDLAEVRVSVSLLATYLVNEAELIPQDPQRFFTPEQRRQILERANNLCECRQCSQHPEAGPPCGTELTSVNFQADHIIPHAANGQTTLENSQALCSGCNARKGSSMAYINQSLGA